MSKYPRLPPLLTLFSLLFLLCNFASSINVIQVKDPKKIKIAFGSCNKMYSTEPTEIFNTIADLNPDVFIWLGDAAYTDKHTSFSSSYFRDYVQNLDIVKSRFNTTKEDEPYQNLLKVTKVIGVWDDHDYGSDNGDKTFEYKDIAQQLYLDFLDEPEDSPRRARQGVYESYYIGTDRRVKVILLDVRYHRDPRPFMGLGSDGDRDVLGEAQWKWLENELLHNHAEYVLIGSGIQILPDDKLFLEHWYDGSRERLLSLLKKYTTHGAILLSGDVHFGEMMEYPCWKQRFGYGLYEFTSSWLTHNSGRPIPLIDKLIYKMFPKTFSDESKIYVGLNFGLVTVEFPELQESNITVQIKNSDGYTTLQKKFKRSDLLHNLYPKKQMQEACVLDTPAWKRILWNIYSRIKNKEWQMWLTLVFFVGVLALVGFCLKVIISFVVLIASRATSKSKTE